MVLQGLLGGALAYANTAYTYNLGRYEFDSNQAQTSAHMLMNFRLAQWNLFREDIRDLFTLTTSHMSTYMVVGTLFLGFTVSFVWSGIKDFPVDPPWLLLLWGNCFISSLSYGVLSVWLAMHGSITANSSSVRVLAQFIRPPIPTAEELRTACHALGGYEAGGMETLLKPPDVLGARSKAQNLLSRMSQRGEAAGDDGTSSAQGGSSAAGSHVQSEALGAGLSMNSGVPRTASPRPRRESSAGAASQAPSQSRPPPAALAGLYDTIGSPIGSGPGRAATLESHIQLFRKEQATFLSFDAYARVCLAGCASQLLLAFAYFIVAYTLERFHQKTTIRWAAIVFCWGCTSMIIFTSLSLFKLDLYVERTRMRSVKGILVLGPLFTSIASQLRIQGGQAHVVWLLVFLATVLHIAWSVIFLYEARPVGYFQLPMSFRSVRYLDIFGYSTEDAPQGLQRGQVPSDLPQVREDEEKAQAEGLEEAIKRLLQPGGYAEQLSENERQQLQEMYRRCQSSGPRRSSVSSPASPVTVGRWWLRCEHVADSGQPLPYYVNAWTSDVRWEVPEGAHIISMSGQAAQSFLGAPPLDPALEREVSSSFQVTPAFEIEGPPDEATAPRRPGSKYNQASMPWKYFMQITLFMIGLWCMTLVYIIVDRHYLLMRTGTAPPDSQQLAFAWPHEFFSPVALACEGGMLFLGDRFEVYAGELPAAAPPGLAGHGEGAAPWPLRLHPLLRAEDLPGPWQSFAALCGDSDGPGGCSALLLLDQDGRTVWERPLPGHGAAAAALRSWPLGAGVAEPLRTIGLLDGRAAAGHCGGCGALHNASAAAGAADWALLGATERGEAVVLCPRGGRLQPARRVARRPQVQEPGQKEEELLAVHSDAAGRLWLLERAGDGAAALRRAAAAAAGVPARAHALPAGRRWACGICEVGQGFVMAAEAEQPELWYLPLPGGGAPDRRAGSRARQPAAPLEAVV